jgi:hypothetical protein
VQAFPERAPGGPVGGDLLAGLAAGPDPAAAGARPGRP